MVVFQQWCYSSNVHSTYSYKDLLDRDRSPTSFLPSAVSLVLHTVEFIQSVCSVTSAIISSAII